MQYFKELFSFCKRTYDIVLQLNVNELVIQMCKRTYDIYQLISKRSAN